MTEDEMRREILAITPDFAIVEDVGAVYATCRFRGKRYEVSQERGGRALEDVVRDLLLVSLDSLRRLVAV